MHLYVHVPFCARRCSYCDFAIAVRKDVPDALFVDSILREWSVRASESAPGDPIETIYFGGGTPSRLAPASVARLIAEFRNTRTVSARAEITLETNPDDVTAERAVEWARAGVNRVSLGVQSHDPAVLEWMHRTHRAEQAKPAMRMLRDAGIDNISTDLIFSLPVELHRDWGDDFERTLDLEPTHISLYGLTIEPHTPLHRWAERGTTIAAPDERYADEYLAAHARMVAAGFEHYEVSNAGLPGFRSRHNSAYWSGAPYIGLGPSAHSLAPGVRSWNVREWAEYARLSAAGGSTVGGSETLGDSANQLEALYLGLRSDRGVLASELAPSTTAEWMREGWAQVASGRVTLTIEGWLRLDVLVATARHS